MSEVLDDDTKDLNLENISNDGSIELLSDSAEERLLSMQYDEIRERKMKILEYESNIINDDLYWISIVGKKFQIRECIWNESTEDKITVTIDNKKFVLMKKSSKIPKIEESDVHRNETSEQKENQSFMSSGSDKKQPPLVKNRVYTPWYNPESIIEKQIPYDKEYVESMNHDTVKCLQHLLEIIQLIFVGLNNIKIDEEVLVNILEKVKKKYYLNDQMFTINTSEVGEQMKKYFLEKMKSIIAKQIENKRGIVMGYPALKRFDAGSKLLNNIEYKIIGSDLYSLKRLEACSSENQDTNQSKMRSEEIASSEKIAEMRTTMENLRCKEFSNNEREKFIEELIKFLLFQGKPIIKDITLDIFSLYKFVTAHGGFVEVTKLKLWPEIYKRIYGRNHKINVHMYGYSPRVGSCFSRYFYTLYLYSYELLKDSFPTPFWLLPTNSVYCSNFRRRIIPRNRDILFSEKSNLSKIAIEKLVRYLRSNKYPNPDLFPKSITYILQNKYNTDENVSTMSSTIQISETSMIHLKYPSYSEIRSNEPNTQINMAMKEDSSSKTICRTDNRKRNMSSLRANKSDVPSSSTNQTKEKPQVEITNLPESDEFFKNDPMEITSELLSEEELELDLELVTTVDPSTATSEEIYYTPNTSSIEEDWSLAEAWLKEQEE